METWRPLKYRRNGEHFYSEDWTSSVTFYTIKTMEEFGFYEKKNKTLYLRTDFPKNRKNQLRREIQKCGRFDIEHIGEYMNMVGGI